MKTFHAHFLSPLARTVLCVGAATTLGLSATGVGAQTHGAARTSAGAAAALKVGSAQVGAATDGMTVIAEAKLSYPYSGRSATTYKLMDGKGELSGLTLDEQLQPVDARKLADSERQARRAKLGALDEAVASRLKALGGARLPVMLWLAGELTAPTPRPPATGEPLDPKWIDQLLLAADAGLAKVLERRINPVLELVRVHDSKARSGVSAPYIMAELGADALRSLALHPEIDRIYHLGEVSNELLVAKQATGLDVVALAGLHGQGVRVAAIEAQAGTIEPNSLLIRPVLQNTLNVCAGQVSGHATSVAGVMLERRLSYFNAGEEGVASGVQLWAGGSCSNRSDQMIDAQSRAADWGARAINLSFGSDTQLNLNGEDRAVDALVFNRWRTVVKSAGNRPCTAGDGNVTSPGLAYNVVTVGGFDDRGTPTWADDMVDVCASFLNPMSRHGDRQKPELAAPSVNIEVVTAGPANLVVGTGTSLAAPFVTGTAALMIERQSRLSVWPEITRAVLMATARHNIEGASRLSDVDGAGGLVAQAALDLLLAPDRWGGQHYDCAGVAAVTPVATVAASPRTRHRVVLSWSTDPSHVEWSSQPSSDIDLTVVDRNGRIVASSSSFDNTSEIVEFDSLTADVYTVQARRFRCDRNTWLGWAFDTQPMPSGR